MEEKLEGKSARRGEVRAWLGQHYGSLCLSFPQEVPQFRVDEIFFPASRLTQSRPGAGKYLVVEEKHPRGDRVHVHPRKSRTFTPVTNSVKEYIQ